MNLQHAVRYAALRITIVAFAAAAIPISTHAPAAYALESAPQAAPAKAKPAQKKGAGASAKSAFDALPSVVVKTVPAQCDRDVDPATTAIELTYSKEMIATDYSIVKHSNDTFPGIDGKPSYNAAERTYSIPVKLKPGQTYAIWFNTPRFGNFKDLKGASAVPYCLMFRTSN
jgi:RNA polymerase sigma-70 factor (ECF subfamily)